MTTARLRSVIRAGQAPVLRCPSAGALLEIGKGRVLQEGEDVAILSFGAHLTECKAAAALLAEEGMSVTLADARFAKPSGHRSGAVTGTQSPCADHR